MKKNILLAFAPSPPPYCGPELATLSLFKDLSPGANWDYLMVKSNVRLSNEKKGRWDIPGTLASLKTLMVLSVACLRHRPRWIYFLLCSSRVGFIRDTAVVLIARFFRCKVIAHYRGGNFDKFYSGASPLYQRLIRFTLKKIDHLIVQANCLKNIFGDLFLPQKISVLHNGLSPEVLSRARQAIPSNKKQDISILFLNHVSFTKGFYDLSLAFEKICKEKNNVRLLVAGDLILDPVTQEEFLSGPHKIQYKKNASSIRQHIIDFVRPNHSLPVYYQGIVTGDAKWDLYEQSQIFVLPSYTEGFPNALLEAMAFGLACVVTPVGAIPEILKEKENALFVQPGDIPSLQKQLTQLIENEDLRREMGIKNHLLATSQYTIRTVQEDFKRVLSHLF